MKENVRMEGPEFTYGRRAGAAFCARSKKIRCLSDLTSKAGGNQQPPLFGGYSLHLPLC